jgi:hypothetical protein
MRARPKVPPPRDALTFTLTGAASLCGLSVATLRRRAKDGSLLLVRVGSRTLVIGDSFRQMLGTNAAEEPLRNPDAVSPRLRGEDAECSSSRPRPPSRPTSKLCRRQSFDHPKPHKAQPPTPR